MKRSEISGNPPPNENSSLDYFFRHPLVISMITLTIGSGLFSYINDQRKNEDLRKQKTIEFLDKTSQEFDELIIYIGGAITSRDISKSSIEKIHANYADLLALNTKIQISSSVYFMEKEFYFKMKNIIVQLGKIYEYLKIIYQGKYISETHDKQIAEETAAYFKTSNSKRKLAVQDKPFSDLELWFRAVNDEYIHEMEKATLKILN